MPAAPKAASAFRLKRIVTIKNRRDFLSANSGDKWIAPALILQMKKRSADHPVQAGARIGYTVTKKMGNAVARNRIKRRLREALKHMSVPMKDGHDYVIISRQKALDCEFTALVRDMEFAFSRIGAKKDAT